MLDQQTKTVNDRPLSRTPVCQTQKTNFFCCKSAPRSVVRCIQQPNRRVFYFTRFQKSIRFDRSALAFSSSSENELSREVHLHYNFIEQGREY